MTTFQEPIDKLSAVSQSFTDNIEYTRGLDPSLQERINDKVAQLTMDIDTMSTVEALALAIAEIAPKHPGFEIQRPMPDDILDLVRDTPEAAADRAHSSELAQLVQQRHINELSKIARDFATSRHDAVA
jgi:hypothetical protein